MRYLEEALNFMESKTMREYLRNTDERIMFRELCSLIALSRAGIAEKEAALRKIAAVHQADKFTDPLGMAEEAHLAQKLLQSDSPGTVFLLTEYWRGNQDETPDEAGDWDFVKQHSEAYHTFGQAIRAMQEEDDEVNESPEDQLSWDDGDCWNEITRCDLNEEGYLEKVIKYTVGVSGTIWGFRWPDEGNESRRDYRSRNRFDIKVNIDLPMPFQPGDIITVDSRPFQRLFHTVVLENSMPVDCCSLQCLYVDWDGTLNYGAFKHNLRGEIRVFSPILRADYYTGELPESEQPLAAVSKALRRRPELGQEIFEYFRKERSDEKAEWGELKEALRIR